MKGEKSEYKYEKKKRKERRTKKIKRHYNMDLHLKDKMKGRKNICNLFDKKVSRQKNFD